jgi:hypothetical protein
MSKEEEATSFSAVGSQSPDSSLRSTATAAVADAAACCSLGVDGGEQRGDPKFEPLAGAFLEPSLGDVTAATATAEAGMEGIAMEDNAGVEGNGCSTFSFTKKSS